MCLLFIIVWRRAFAKITGPRDFHSKRLLGAYTHPVPTWTRSSEALSTCLFIYVVAWFFSEVLSYRAIPIKITPELSINTLAQKFQAANKSVKLVTCGVLLFCYWTTGTTEPWACCGDEPPSSSLCPATSSSEGPCCRATYQEHGSASWSPPCDRDARQNFWTRPRSPPRKYQGNH